MVKMKDNKDKATGYKFEPMPATMTDEVAERQARQQVEQMRDEICGYVAKFRDSGVLVSDEDELRQLTPQAVKDQIEQTRKRRLGEKFLPQSIRKAEETAFAKMARTLVPLASDLQTFLSRTPFRIHVAENADDTYFEADQVEAFVEKAATVAIPKEIVEYYDHLQKVCASWHNLCEWCAAHDYTQPEKTVLNALCPDARPGEGCSLSLTPERMLQMYNFGILRQIK